MGDSGSGTAGRLAQLRTVLFGHQGKAKMAKWLETPRNSYGRYEDGTPLPESVLATMARKRTPRRPARVNVHWLLTGEGEMFLPTDSAVFGVSEAEEEYGDRAARVVLRLREITQMVESGELSFVGRPGTVPDAAGELPEGSRYVRVPIYGGAVAAGNPREVDEEPEDWAWCYKAHVPHPEQTTAVRVAGESMLDLIPDGSLVGVDHAVRDLDTILRAELPLAVVRDEDGTGVLVRDVRVEAGHALFEPRNKAGGYPSRIIKLSEHDPESEGNPIVGQVVWIYRDCT